MPDPGMGSATEKVKVIQYGTKRIE